MEASALTYASRGGLLARRSPLLRLQGDERLIALIRAGHDQAFEILFERYHSRLLAFCRNMLRSTEDAEDVLQEVFVKAHAAILADNRAINVRPWLYRIARNRCLNHLRKPVAEGADSMDVLPHDGGTTTAQRVQDREDFRCLVADVKDLAETQRTALLLREIEALSYEEIASAMETTVPAVKSLLVRARMSLAEASQSRHLTCGEVRLELAEAAEGLRKASGPVRHHVRRCEHCREFRGELQSNRKALAALAPLGPLALLHKAIIAKLGFGGAGSASGAGAASGSGAGALGSGAAGTGAAAGAGSAGGAAAAGGGAAAIGAAGAAAGAGTSAVGATAAGAGAVAGAGAAAAAGGSGAMLGGAAAAGGIGSAIGAKAAATAATAALLTAGAVEVRHLTADKPVEDKASQTAISAPPAQGGGVALPHEGEQQVAVIRVEPAPDAGNPALKHEEGTAPTAGEEPVAAPPEAPAEEPTDDAVTGPAAGGVGAGGDPGAAGSSTGGTATVVVTQEPSTTTAPPPAEPPPASEPAPTSPPPPPPSDEPEKSKPKPEPEPKPPSKQP